MKKAKDVDEYIARAPKEAQPKLRQVRETIRCAAPKAEERMGYGMPYYHYLGRLAYFGLAKSHIGLYLPTPVVEDHEMELKGYDTTRATVRLPLDAKIPVGLIRKLVRAEVKMNEAKEQMVRSGHT